MTEDELEHLAATGEWPNRPDPLPGTSRLDRMSRKELIELWKENQDRFVGRNQEQFADRPDPPPGTSRLDRMNRKELIEVWKENQDRFVGRNQEQFAFYARHG